jgi:DNA replication and repair protein RecF
VHVSAVECRGFRNLSDARVELGPGITVFHGANGAGKTNLLEAVYFGLAARSFRTGNDRDLIRFDHPSARVELELSGPGRPTLLAALDRGGERRHRLDGQPLPAAAQERPLVSVFHPDRMELVKGPAARRRGHLDRLIGALWPARADLRARYGRTLAQRNALVARVRAEQASAESLVTWDERLAEEAVPLIEARREAIEALGPPVEQTGSALGLVGLEVRYRPRADPDPDRIAAELAARRQGALGRAYTSYGPQLDEVELRAEERPLRRFGSQGQQRAALLSLLFAERAVLIGAGRPPPLMLLDDVMSELDPERRELLVGTLAGAGQALVTATEASQVPAAEGIRAIAVREGRTAAPLSEAARAPDDDPDRPIEEPGREAA